MFKPSGVRRVFGRPGDGIGRTIIGESEDVQRRLLLLGEKAGLRADKNNLLLAPALCFGGGQQGRGEFFVKGKQKFHALAVGLEFFRAVAEVHGAVQGGMGLGERGRHGERVVKVGERGVFCSGGL